MRKFIVIRIIPLNDYMLYLYNTNDSINSYSTLASPLLLAQESVLHKEAKMPDLTRAILVNAPIEKVWAVLANIGAVQDYSPSVVKSYFTSDIKEGVDASRHCDLLPKGTVEERIVDWHEGKQYSIEIYEGTEIPYTGVAHFALERDGVGTRVIEVMDYKPTNELPIDLKRKSIEGLVGKIVEGNLVGLKHFVETGEIVTREVFRRIKKSGGK